MRSADSRHLFYPYLSSFTGEVTKMLKRNINSDSAYIFGTIIKRSLLMSTYAAFSLSHNERISEKAAGCICVCVYQDGVRAADGTDPNSRRENKTCTG